MRISRGIFFLLIFLAFTAGTGRSGEFKIGVLLSLSSWGVRGGLPELNAMQMAQEEINASGGVAGRPLKFVIEDNRSDLAATATAFRKLASIDKVVAVLGPNWSEFVDIAAPLARDLKLPLISASGYKKEQLKDDPWFFTLMPPMRVATRPMADYMLKRGHRKVRVLLAENSYYAELYEAISVQLAAGGVQTEVEQFQPGVFDYRSAIARSIRRPADALLVLLAESGEFYAFIKQARELRLAIPLYAANTLGFDEAMRKDPALGEGIVYFDFKIPGQPAFQDAYRRRYKEEPGLSSAKAYDSVFLLKQAAERCGLSPDQIRSCLRNIDYRGLSARITFDDRGLIRDEAANTDLMQIRKGRAELIQQQIQRESREFKGLGGAQSFSYLPGE